MTDPAQLRSSYRRGRLDEETVGGSWLAQLRDWFDQAVADPAVVEANAMQLATSDATGRPSVRTVLAKSIDERGIVFYTNYTSAKAADLEANPRAAVVFAWLAHERQVRLSGAVERVTRDETAAYFGTRPRGSQIGAWASPQSSVVTGQELAERVADVERRFSDGPIPPPDDWGGYLLRPDLVEFWQGRPDRLHDRIRFRATAAGWSVDRLAP